MFGIELTTDQMVVLGCISMLATSLFFLQCGWWIHQSKQKQSEPNEPTRVNKADAARFRDADRITSA